MRCSYCYAPPKAGPVMDAANHAAQWQEEHFRHLERSYRKLAKLYRRWTEEGRKFYLSPFETKLSSHIDRHRYRKERCELAARQLSVDHTGTLYPCVQFVGAGSDWIIGHVATGIDEGRRQAVRAASEADKADCRGCALAPRCHNTCGCLNRQTTGSINRVSPVLCRHERILIPIVDGLGEWLFAQRSPLFIQQHYNEAYPVLSLLEDVGEGG